MTEAAAPPPPRRDQRAGATVVGVAGELLVTLGVLILLFLGWQLWFNNVVSSATQKNAADDLSEQWDVTPTAASTSTPDPANPGDRHVRA